VLSLLQHSTLNTHDRFLDSLLFVGAINNHHSQNAYMNADGGELSVDIWPFKFNFMAFFETEMEELREQKEAAADVHEVVFGHFLTDTYLYCFLGEEGIKDMHISVHPDLDGTDRGRQSQEDACNCMYYNTRVPKISLLHEAISKTVSVQCRVFAGENEPYCGTICSVVICCMSGWNDPPLPLHRQTQHVYLGVDHGHVSLEPEVIVHAPSAVGITTEATQNSQSVPPEDKPVMDCTQLWPPVSSSFDLRISSIRDEVAFDVHFACKLDKPRTLAIKAETQASQNYLHFDEMRISVQYVVLYETGHAFCKIESVIGTDGIHSLPTMMQGHNASDDNGEILISSVVRGYMECAEDASQHFQGSTFRTHADILATLSKHIHGAVPAADPQQTLLYRFGSVVKGTITLTDLQPSGVYSYTLNQLLGPKPVALSTQAQFVRVLNERKLHGTGVAICCDTLRGLQTVKQIALGYERGYVVIILASLPQQVVFSSATGTEGSNSSTPLMLLSAVLEELKGVCVPKLVVGDTTHMPNTDKLLPKTANTHCIILHSTHLSMQDKRSRHTGTSAGATTDVDGDNKKSMNTHFNKEGRELNQLIDQDIIMFMAKAFTSNTLKFLLIDVFRTHAHYLAMLNAWWPVLNTHGIMLGTRYTNSLVRIPTLVNGHYQYESEYLSIEKIIMNQAHNVWGVSLLVTYEEHLSAVCRQFIRAQRSEVDNMDVFDASLTTPIEHQVIPPSRSQNMSAGEATVASATPTDQQNIVSTHRSMHPTNIHTNIQFVNPQGPAPMKPTTGKKLDHDGSPVDDRDEALSRYQQQLLKAIVGRVNNCSPAWYIFKGKTARKHL
jgi:hypothetical protein